MKNIIRIFTASLVVILLFSVHCVYGFKNPYWNTKGTVTKIKELQDGTFLVVFNNSTSGYVELAHISVEGELLVSTILSRKNQNYSFNALYEHNGEYAVSMCYIEVGSSYDIKYLEFRFFDTAFNLLRALKHVVDDKVMSDVTNHYMNDQLTWSGIVRNGQNVFLKTIQYGPNGVKKYESLNGTSKDTGYCFIRTFRFQNRSTVFTYNQSVLCRFDFDSVLNLTRKDTIPRVYNTNRVGEKHQYSWITDIVSLNDSQFVGIFADTTNNTRPQDSAFYYSTCEVDLVKIQDYNITSSKHTVRQLFWYNLLVSTLSPHLEYLKVDKEKAEINVLYQYEVDTSNYVFFSRPDILKYSFNLDSLNGLKFAFLPDVDTLNGVHTIDMLQSGGYVIGGGTFSGMGYIGIIDSSGMFSALPLLEQEQEKITLYPNPGRNIIMGLPQNGTITLYNIVGQQFEYTIEQSEVKVDDLGSGVYFYRIQDEYGTIVGSGKWIKQH